MNECYVIIDLRLYSQHIDFSGIERPNQYQVEFEYIQNVLSSPTTLRAMEFLGTERFGILSNDDTLFCVHRFEHPMAATAMVNEAVNEAIQGFFMLLRSLHEMAGLPIMELPDPFELNLRKAFFAFTQSLECRAQLTPDDYQMLQALIEERRSHTSNPANIHPLIVELLDRYKHLN